ncbi:MAG: hypothetical protein WEC84_04905 [Candidatus Andersenbacteria bacterium]
MVDLKKAHHTNLMGTVIGFYASWLALKMYAMSRTLAHRMIAIGVLQAVALVCTNLLPSQDLRVWVAGATGVVSVALLLVVWWFFNRAVKNTVRAHSIARWLREIESGTLTAGDNDFLCLFLVPALAWGEGADRGALRHFVKEAMLSPGLSSLAFIQELHAYTEGKLRCGQHLL